MRRIFFVIGILTLSTGCGELQSVINNLPTAVSADTSKNNGKAGLSNIDMSNGLKQALEMGLSQGVDMLSQQDGFYKNELAKILLPEPLQKIDQTLRSIGLSSLSDQGLKLLNRAAEDAVSEAKPIFINAIKNLSFTDVASILSGESNAATKYLQNNTTESLVKAFAPKIQSSLDKVGANQIWSQIMTRYNAIPMVTPVNADLTGYVTEKAISGLFLQIAEKEKGIRNNVAERTTPLLQKVFSNIGK